MASEQDVLYAIELLHQHKPYHPFADISKNEMGLFAVLRYLVHAEQAAEQQGQGAGFAGVNSKELSNAMQVSSARMTVVLKKLEQKNYIYKTSSPDDARAVLILLSDKGRACSNQLKKQMYQTMERIVDEIGMDELKKLFETLSHIQSILYETRPIQLEDDYV